MDEANRPDETRSAMVKPAPKVQKKPAPKTQNQPAVPQDAGASKPDGLSEDARDAQAAEKATAGGKPPPLPQKPPKTSEQLAYEAARRAHFKAYYWQPVLRPIVVLTAICVIASLLLGLTNAVTQPVIAENAAAAAQAERKLLLPGADSFEEVPAAGAQNVTAIYRAANGAGWVIEAFARGYGGKVPVMVAFGPGGAIVGVSFPENSETVGLGQKVREASFAAQFTGRPADNVSLGDVDKIASATVSTGAAVNAVNAAIAAYHLQLGHAALPTDPVAVREYLLPGEVLVPVAVTAENVLPTAWASNAGHYILYGIRPAEGQTASTVTAAVAVNADGVILNLWIDTSGEGEQYGQTLASNRAFLGSFIGLSAPVQVDAVADITSSSHAVMQAVNNALAALPLVKEAA